MALTAKCPHCDGTTFEIEEVQALGAAFKHYFIQCSQCGAPAGVVEYENIGALISELEDKLMRGLGALDASLKKIASQVDRLERRLGK